MWFRDFLLIIALLVDVRCAEENPVIFEGNIPTLVLPTGRGRNAISAESLYETSSTTTTTWLDYFEEAFQNFKRTTGHPWIGAERLHVDKFFNPGVYFAPQGHDHGRDPYNRPPPPFTFSQEIGEQEHAFPPFSKRPQQQAERPGLFNPDRPATQRPRPPASTETVASPPTTTQSSNAPHLVTSELSITISTLNPQTFQCVLNCPATNQHDPVCGTDGITYANINKLRCAAQRCRTQATMDHRGACVNTPSSPMK